MMEVKYRYDGIIFTGDLENPAYANVFFYEEKYNLKTWEKVSCPMNECEDDPIDENGNTSGSLAGVDTKAFEDLLEQKRKYYEHVLLNGKGA